MPALRASSSSFARRYSDMLEAILADIFKQVATKNMQDRELTTADSGALVSTDPKNMIQRYNVSTSLGPICSDQD
jgi:F0F1-type ATP synthase gamma subunit